VIIFAYPAGPLRRRGAGAAEVHTLGRWNLSSLISFAKPDAWLPRLIPRRSAWTS
jgi:hypothetical protein